MRLVRILALAFVVVLAACGSSGSKTTSTATTTASATTASSGVAIDSAQTSLGSVLVNSQGRTLYHFTKDTATTIACTGACATTWPPVTVPPGQQPKTGSGVTATLTVVDRPDGTKQVAANGQPLYMFSGDTKAGDTNGQGFGGFWFALMSSGSSVSAGGTSATTTKATTATTAASSGGMPGY